MLWGYATLVGNLGRHGKSQTFINSMAGRVHECLEEGKMGAREISNVCWAFATLGETPAPMLLAALKQAAVPSQSEIPALVP